MHPRKRFLQQCCRLSVCLSVSCRQKQHIENEAIYSYGHSCHVVLYRPTCKVGLHESQPLTGNHTGELKHPFLMTYYDSSFYHRIRQDWLL